MSDSERDPAHLDDLLRRMQRALGLPEEDDEEAEPRAPDDADEEDLDGVLDEALGLLGRLVDRLPQDLARLSAEVMEEALQAESGVDERVGLPDWGLDVEVVAGDALHLRIGAEFDLTELLALGSWAEANAPTADEAVAPTVERLAAVRRREVVRCELPGAAGGEAQLAGEGLFPIRLRGGVLHVELAPVLVLRVGEGSEPLAIVASTEEELAVPVERFDEGESFSAERTLQAAEPGPATVRLAFRMLEV